jgi:hypothetical protein
LRKGIDFMEEIMKRKLFLVIALATTLPAIPAMASPIDASAVLTSTPDGSNFNDSITLTNSSSSTDSIGTFWFGWVPGADLLPTSPVNITAPAGWTELVTHAGTGDGFAIQFVAGAGSALAPGNSLSGFGFTSADTPAQLAANSPFFSSIPATTSVVYNGAPLTGDSEQFVVSVATAPAPMPTASSVPEPSSLMVGLVVATWFGCSRFKRRKGTA